MRRNLLLVAAALLMTVPSVWACVNCRGCKLNETTHKFSCPLGQPDQSCDCIIDNHAPASCTPCGACAQAGCYDSQGGNYPCPGPQTGPVRSGYAFPLAKETEPVLRKTSPWLFEMGLPSQISGVSPSLGEFVRKWQVMYHDEKRVPVADKKRVRGYTDLGAGLTTFLIDRNGNSWRIKIDPAPEGDKAANMIWLTNHSWVVSYMDDHGNITTMANGNF